jgi:hypothetical protein
MPLKQLTSIYEVKMVKATKSRHQISMLYKLMVRDCYLSLQMCLVDQRALHMKRANKPEIATSEKLTRLKVTL